MQPSTPSNEITEIPANLQTGSGNLIENVSNDNAIKEIKSSENSNSPKPNQAASF